MLMGILSAILFFTYDALGRIVAVTAGTGNDSVSIQTYYTKTGQIAFASNGWQETEYQYDELGRAIIIYERQYSGMVRSGGYNSDCDDELGLEEENSSFESDSADTISILRTNSIGFEYEKSFTYDLSGNRTSLTVEQDNATIQDVAYTYDNLHRLSSVIENQHIQVSYTYDVNSNRTSLSYNNGITETYTYNLANWLTGLTNTNGNDVISSFAYSYYASGSQKTKTDAQGTITSYVYDDLGRLTQESETGGTTLAYRYDVNGNRISVVASGAEVYTTTYSYDNANRLLTEYKDLGATSEGISYTYDANGNTISSNGIYVALHEIAQLNFSKKLYDQTREIPQLEYRIIQKANRDEHGAYRKTYCELDVVHKTLEDVMNLYEIKPMGRSAKSQIEKYVEISGFSAGGWIGNIPDIEILSLKDYKICMEISSRGKGEVYYRLYNSVTNERVTNKEFVEIYDLVAPNKRQNEGKELTIDFPSIEDLIPEVLLITVISIEEVIIENINHIIEFAVEDIIPCLG